MQNNKIVMLVAGVAAVVVVAGGVWYAMSLSNENSAPTSDGNTAVNNEEPSGPVAVVNGEEIPRSEFNRLEAQMAAQQQRNLDTMDAQTRERLQASVVDMLVAQTLLRQTAADVDISVAEADIDEQMDSMKEQFENDAAFQEALSAEGMTQEGLRAQVRADLAIQAYLEEELSLSDMSVTDADVEATYEQLSAGGNAPPLEEAREQIEQITLQQQQQEKVGAFVEELRKGADVEILL